MRILSVATLAGALLLLPSHAAAQASATDQESGWGIISMLDYITDCQLRFLVNPGPRPECLHDERAEKHFLQSRARSYARYWQMGVMIVSQVYMGVRWGMDVYEDFGNAYNNLKAAVSGFSLTRDPLPTVQVIRRNSVEFERRLDRSGAVALQYRLEKDRRYERISIIAMEGIRAAKVVQDNAASLSERVIEMSARLGEVRVLEYSGGLDRTIGSGTVRIPKSADEEFSQDDVESLYDAIRTAATSPSLTGPARSSSIRPGGSDASVCELDAGNSDTAETFYRAQNMAIGSQLGAGGVSAEAAMRMEELDALNEAEKQRDRDIKSIVLRWTIRRL
jgi:hypothetical protein